MTRNWSLGRSLERAMIVEESNVLRPDYLPFAAAQRQAAYTAFEMTSGSGNGANTTHLPEGRSLPKRVIPAGGTSLEEAERALVELAMLQASRNMPPNCRTSALTRCVIS